MNDIIIDFCVDSTSLITFKKCNVMRPDKETCREIGNIYQVNMQQCS